MPFIFDQHYAGGEFSSVNEVNLSVIICQFTLSVCIFLVLLNVSFFDLIFNYFIFVISFYF